jgi:hypothetical protein
MGKIWDKFGICASTLCLIHCIATPIIILLFPSIDSFLGNTHIVHEIFAVIVISLVVIAVYPQCRKHGHKDIIAFAVIGSALIITAIFMFEENITLHYILTIAGSISLITAHVKNMKLRHNKCDH